MHFPFAFLEQERVRWEKSVTKWLYSQIEFNVKKLLNVTNIDESGSSYSV